MDNLDNLSSTSTNAQDGTFSSNSPPTSLCSCQVQSSQDIEHSIITHPSDAACHGCVIRTASTNSNTQTSSTCSITSVFDEEYNDSSAESNTAPSHLDSDRDIAKDDCRSTVSRALSAPDSVVDSLSSTSAQTLVEDAASDHGSILESSQRYAQSITNVNSDVLSDGGSVICGQTGQFEPDITELSAAKTFDLAKNTIPEGRMHVDDEPWLSTERTNTNAPFDVGKFTDDQHVTFEYYLKRLGRQSFRQRYLGEDPSSAPWTVFHLRSAGSICAFCGSTFTGHDHKQKVINHTRDMHLPTVDSLSATAGKSRRTFRFSGPPKASDLATKASSHNPSGYYPRFDSTPRWPDCHLLQDPIDFKGIGAQWMDELRSRQQASAPGPLIAHPTYTVNHADRFNHPPSAQILHRIEGFLKSADGRSKTEKLNDIFNGFDLVAEDLSRRFPHNKMVRGVRDALDALDQILDVRPSRRFVPLACNTHSGSAPQDTNSVPSSSTASASTCGRGISGAQRPGVDKKSSQPRGRRNTPGPGTTTTTRDKKQQLRNRYLACPFRKDDLIHNRPPTCKFPGADSMSSLRLHLAGQQHRNALLFIDLCSSCKDYVIDIDDWSNIHSAGRCILPGENTRVQVRNSPGNDSRVGAQWMRLFVRLFPRSQRLPSPYIHDPSWIPMPAMEGIEQTEHVARTEFPLFNISDLPCRTARHNDPTIALTHEPTISHVLFLSRDGAPPVTRSAVLEPTPAGPQFQDLTPPPPRSFNDDSAFLDDTAGTLRYDTRQASDSQPQSRDLGFDFESSGVEDPISNHSEEEFEQYFNFDVGMDHQLSSMSQEHAGTDLENQDDRDTNIQPQQYANNIDSTRDAPLLFLLQTIERLLQPVEASDEQADIMTQLTHVNAMTPERSHTFSDTVLARIEQLRSNLQNRDVIRPLSITPDSQRVAPIARTSLNTVPHHGVASNFPLPGHNHLPLEQVFPDDIFAPTPWDDTPFLNGNSSPDPSIRTFFPEDILINS